MGTRAVITFKDDDGSHSVYQHWDGYPEDIKKNIEKAKSLAWPLPRFEADEFAAAYVAVNKNGEGNIRLTKGVKSHCDLAYSYIVKCVNGVLKITSKKEVFG